jgi:hypothetical protein
MVTFKDAQSSQMSVTAAAAFAFCRPACYGSRLNGRTTLPQLLIGQPDFTEISPQHDVINMILRVEGGTLTRLPGPRQTNPEKELRT